MRFGSHTWFELATVWATPSFTDGEIFWFDVARDGHLVALECGTISGAAVMVSGPG